MIVKEIEISKIQQLENVRVDLKNIDQLMRNMDQHGLLNPITVMPDKSGAYIIVAGNRRLAAGKKLGWKKIDASVLPEMKVSDLLFLNSIENIQREDITPAELGRICDKLKKMELNIAEIAAKLNIPEARVRGALDVYYELPDKYRTRVSYIGRGETINKGAISATVAMKIISCKRAYGLSDASAEKLFSVAHAEELSVPKMNLIAKFLEEGLTVEKSLKKAEDYSPTRCDIFVNKQEMNEALKKYKMDSSIMLLAAIVYGEIPPLKKPDFVNFKQIPDKSGK